MPYPGSPIKARQNMVGMFSVRSIWPTDEERKAAVSELYNFKTLRKRKWLQDVLLEESDSDSDGEFPFTLPDLHTIVKAFEAKFLWLPPPPIVFVSDFL
ncbi:unnamed protein product [Gongylonema pulchrum]|uniref:Uncharacterized protein n=1 Tax=Gongylonema pulchrum TaxID=637853 RepID=A0A3P7MY56_9BILA|nr:unnamed protein product [Gongylonema pulchrum]